MDTLKQYISMILMILTIFIITTKPSHAKDQENKNIIIPNDPSSSTKSLFPTGKKTVVIVNGLGTGVTLPYHCKSKDDDFGARSLPPGGLWSFRFRPQFFGRSLYFCSFELQRGRVWFDIYRNHRDNTGDTWCDKCVWRIKQSGPCRLNDVTKDFDLCYPWNK
ncbi:unnamed protein product [Cochlearia groenlandica]